MITKAKEFFTLYNLAFWSSKISKLVSNYKFSCLSQISILRIFELARFEIRHLN